MDDAESSDIELLPASRPVKPLFILLHDRGGAPEDLLPLVAALRAAYVQAAILVPAAPRADGVRQWFAPDGGDARERAARIAAAVAALEDRVRAAQDRLGVVSCDTALVGVGQGAQLALEFCRQHDGRVGRVLAFGGGFLTAVERAPELTTIHLFHGEEDSQVPVAEARAAFERLAALGGDATLDIASKVGHELHPALVARAIQRLTTCIPLRHWKRALEGLPDH